MRGSESFTTLFAKVILVRLGAFVPPSLQPIEDPMHEVCILISDDNLAA